MWKPDFGLLNDSGRKRGTGLKYDWTERGMERKRERANVKLDRLNVSLVAQGTSNVAKQKRAESAELCCGKKRQRMQVTGGGEASS